MNDAKLLVYKNQLQMCRTLCKCTLRIYLFMEFI